MIVVDASVLAPALADDTADGDRARARLAGEPDLAAPHLVDLEVLSVWRRAARAGDLEPRRTTLAREDLVALPLERFPHVGLLEDVWGLRENVSPYDAAYVVLAGLLGCPLLTADARLARAPRLPCHVELLE